MKNQLCFLFLALTACLLTPRESSAKNPVFAVPVSVPLLPIDEGGQHSILFAKFSIVSTLWLRYFTSKTSQPKKIFFSVENTPRFLTLVNENNQTFNYSTNEQKKREVIEQIAMKVIGDYVLDYLGLQNVTVLKGYDKTRVSLKMFPDVQRWVLFNRTLVLKFANPPYGQSLANRLVTNRNINWIVNETSLRYDDDDKRGNRRDLVYRYYHNLGHALGFGHYYQTSADQIEIRPIHNDTEYRDYYNSIRMTYASLPTKQGRMIRNYFNNAIQKYGTNELRLKAVTPNSFRSVMYMNSSNAEKSAGSATPLDRYAFRYIIMNFVDLINTFIDRFLAEELSPLIVKTMSAARYFS